MDGTKELVDGSTGRLGTGAVERAIGSATARRESMPDLMGKQQLNLGGFDDDPRGRRRNGKLELGGFDDHLDRVTGKREGKDERAVPREPTPASIAKVDAKTEGNEVQVRAELDIAAIWADIRRYNGF
ncbi:MAG: hypothetical protein NT157_05500 [Candidatus Micrarchaeota archaeon]|nr:hypothetical protein [Candidatus Micrarchaeota archaeon]